MGDVNAPNPSLAMASASEMPLKARVFCRKARAAWSDCVVAPSVVTEAGLPELGEVEFVLLARGRGESGPGAALARAILATGP